MSKYFFAGACGWRWEFIYTITIHIISCIYIYISSRSCSCWYDVIKSCADALSFICLSSMQATQEALGTDTDMDDVPDYGGPMVPPPSFAMAAPAHGFAPACVCQGGSTSWPGSWCHIGRVQAAAREKQRLEDVSHGLRKVEEMRATNRARGEGNATQWAVAARVEASNSEDLKRIIIEG